MPPLPRAKNRTNATHSDQHVLDYTLDSSRDRWEQRGYSNHKNNLKRWIGIMSGMHIEPDGKNRFLNQKPIRICLSKKHNRTMWEFPSNVRRYGCWNMWNAWAQSIVELVIFHKIVVKTIRLDVLGRRMVFL
jgi:hypothetical protein